MKTAGGVLFSALPIERLVFHIKAAGDIAARLYEQVLANGLGVGARAVDSRAGLQWCPAGSIREVGFGDLEAMLPATRRSFAGYRLLQEYFALPERYLFFALAELREVLRACDSEQCELFILLDRPQAALENQLDASQFRLGCTPVINLFPRSVDRVQLNPFDTEHHLIPDRNRPQDFEIYSIERMAGIGASSEATNPVHPFYGLDHRTGPAVGQLYYTLQRRPRLLSARQQQTGSRSSYAGAECFVSLAGDPSLQQQLRQLDALALCTNRDLPIQIALGSARSDFLVEGGAPVESVRCITGPTYPRPSSAFGDTAWKLVSHLSLNYLSLLDDGVSESAGLLRDMLSLYADAANPAVVRQVEGLRGIAHEPVVRRLPLPGPISHGRGLRISLTVEEAAFEGTGVLLLASVLERFFAAYVSINSFTQTRVVSSTRGEIKEWPARLGTRPLM
jgi:type VI secretion system protein ImpG